MREGNRSPVFTLESENTTVNLLSISPQGWIQGAPSRQVNLRGLLAHSAVASGSKRAPTTYCYAEVRYFKLLLVHFERNSILVFGSSAGVHRSQINLGLGIIIPN